MKYFRQKSFNWHKAAICAALAFLVACSDDAPTQKQTLNDTGVSDTHSDGRDTTASDVRPDTGDPDTTAVDTTAVDTTDTGGRDTLPGDPDTDTTDAEDTPSNGRTLSDYRRCESNLDCPVGLGVCVKEVSLNRPNAAGENAVAIGEIFPSLGADEGVCTLVCTTGEDVCGALSVNGTANDLKPHTCQLVTAAEAPYPQTPPAFPFGDQLEPVEQAQGQPFGAICRAPFGLDDNVSDAFCEPCSGPDSCGDADSICWNTLSAAPADQTGENGVCLAPCDGDDACPMGFACDAADADGQSYCRPKLDTCSACRDTDQDGFGTGRCGGDDSPVTPYDCDDLNPDAYFDPDNMDHAFPATCGEQDFNCNGLSDAAEQIGASNYPGEHCESCFSTCSGELANGQKFCQQGATPDEGICVAQCAKDGNGNLLFADCDGDISNGCEVPVDDANRQYYRDADHDGFGDPDDVQFDCGNTGPPAGYVANADDCDDTSAAAHGGDNPPAEICDGLDNDCNGSTDEDSTLPNYEYEVGESCNTGYPGVCELGTYVCNGTQGVSCEPIYAQPGDNPELCSTVGVDDDCDGEVDEADADDAQIYYEDYDGDGFGNINSTRSACTQPPGFVNQYGDCWLTNPQVNPNATEVCDGYDNDCDGEIDEDGAPNAPTWYEDQDADGFGDPATATAAAKCEAPSSYQHPVTNDNDCDDNNANINPDADEVCDSFNVDENCDGQRNDGTAVDAETYYPDDDGDGYGQSVIGGGEQRACTQPPGYVSSGPDDCNDSAQMTTDHTPNIKIGTLFNPDHAELCDGHDNDCDWNADEGCPTGEIFWDGSPTFAQPAMMGSSSFSASASAEGSHITQCPENTIMSGIKINYDPSSFPVSWIEPACQKFLAEDSLPNEDDAYDVNNFQKIIKDPDYNSAHPYAGGAFGGVHFQNDHIWFDEGPETKVAFCPDNSAVYKIAIEYGSVVDRLTLHCRTYATGAEPNYYITSGFVDSLAKSFGPRNSGNFSDSQQCETGKVAVGAKVESGYYTGQGRRVWSIARLQLRCVDLKTPKN